MTNLWAFLFVLGVLIFVHELGHFLMARRLGVRVLTFSLGFGPKLLKFTRGDTEHAISAIPLGGYVKMAGENPDEARSGRPDEFLSKTKWERFLVYIMGPAMNLLLAFVVTAAVLYQGAESPTYEQEPPIVGAVIKDSPAARAGLQIGDRIVTVAGREMRTWDQFFIEIGSRADRETEIVVDRGGRRETITVTPEPKTNCGEVGEIGVLPKTRLQLAEVTPRMAADRAGLRRGDVIAALDGKSDPEQQALIAHIKSNPNKPLRFSIVRDGQPMDVTVTPEGDPGSALIGIRISPNSEYPAGVPGSASAQPRQELGMDKAHLPDACRPVYARDVGAAVDGTRRDCRTIRRRGAARVDASLQPHGDDQSQGCST